MNTAWTEEMKKEILAALDEYRDAVAFHEVMLHRPMANKPSYGDSLKQILESRARLEKLIGLDQ